MNNSLTRSNPVNFPNKRYRFNKPRCIRYCGFLVVLFSSWFAEAGCMDTDNAFWKNQSSQRQYDTLMTLMACPLDADKITAPQIDAVSCNYFVAKAIDKLYNVKDFSPDGGGKGAWLTANQIAAYVRKSENWQKLGQADDQSVLNDAAQGAQNGQPVIALTTGDPHGHVALVLPGDPKQSTTWKSLMGASLNAPNSAAFSLNNVNKAYAFCRLSAAFSNPSVVEIYWRTK